MSPEGVREDLARRVDAIEGGYEFLLAYAAQGLSSDAGAASSLQLREHLARFDAALSGLADRFRELIRQEAPSASAAYDPFLPVLGADAAAARAAIGLVLGQDGISSQLVDNLNASIHVRALLTDVFLIDEALKKR